MKILVIGGSGMIGQRVVAEALRRGHTVTALSRHGTAQPGVTAVAGDASDSAVVAEAAAGQDAVVSCVAPPRDGSETTGPFLAIARALLDGLRKAGVRRLVVVGGAGSLEVAPGVRVVDIPGFPDAVRPEALAQSAVLDFLRTVDDLDWTYISPAGGIQPGERTGQFRLGGDRLLTDAAGKSEISAEDYAVALVDELENGNAIRRRITVAY